MPDITKGTTFTSGQTVTASDLNALLDSATINNLSITEAKLADGAVSSSKLGSGAIAYSKLESLADGKLVVGNAGTATPATLSGEASVSYDSSTGNANIALQPAVITGQTSKSSTAHSNDVILIIDSENGNVLRKLTVGNLPTGSTGDTIPAGAMFPFAGGTLPSGWLFCNGDEIDRTTYATLYSAIGTTYGSGNGSSTFNLPDLGGRVPAGKESSESRLTTSGSGIDGDTLGSSGGTETHTLTSGEMPSHTHSHGLSASTSLSAAGYSYWSQISAAGGWHISSSSSTGTYANATLRAGDLGLSAATSLSGSISSTGDSGSHTNTQPTLIVNYIIKH